tara:strand:- start:41 stop:190 length:150 start_codon:yes stop_codon:yes gene_type:complete
LQLQLFEIILALSLIVIPGPVPFGPWVLDPKILFSDYLFSVCMIAALAD